MDTESRSVEQRVKWVYEAVSAGESRDRYDEWAPDYERDLLETYGYRLPDTITDHFTRWVKPPARILDAGVGTGW
jgi:predicted TPR repeat methyltransferase